ncbi:catechol 2,3-dioxygenase-like lactoylglutathione lyase family enzyme [Micromonospora jinlongensis]|uniref:Catechol 2,3-dioxygenase-like lactoylglutathione lyase family enzyme n=1 Tax=Micromonospora jinlongensis TaxID=1287877 RepID=A0A7Y9X7Z5_9ACTN|nr:VOC family protein [Micromonospora jinlongensis]NYH45905.1 catechol 2,3-dioxygenase-like lactoylglutathione lyase family enzyme [Micromonospora jinlongensis]
MLFGSFRAGLVSSARTAGTVVLVDPAGYAFCVIEPGNAYLAGCGFLGELTCDGSRDVGLFWSNVLGWPLVWDQDEETAIQSPRGGTKIAWAGSPVAPETEPNRQRFELVPADGDQQATVAELVSLGATRLDVAQDGAVARMCRSVPVELPHPWGAPTIVLADPDGNEFCVRPTDHNSGASPAAAPR